MTQKEILEDYCKRIKVFRSSWIVDYGRSNTFKLMYGDSGSISLGRRLRELIQEGKVKPLDTMEKMSYLWGDVTEGCYKWIEQPQQAPLNRR